MKAKIKVGFSAKNQAMEFCPVEENDAIEIEIDYETNEDLKKKIEYWQDYVQTQVVSAVFSGSNKFLTEKKKELQTQMKIKKAIEVMSQDLKNDEDKDEDNYYGTKYYKANNIKNIPPSYKRTATC